MLRTATITAVVDIAAGILPPLFQGKALVAAETATETFDDRHLPAEDVIVLDELIRTGKITMVVNGATAQTGFSLRDALEGDAPLQALPIPLSAIKTTVGTWALAVSGNLVTLDKAAADEGANVLYVPICEAFPKSVPHRIDSIDIWWATSVAALTAGPAAALYKGTLPATGVAATGAAVEFAYDSGHDTDAERKTLASHKMRLTPTTPIALAENESLWLVLTITPAATSVVKLAGIQANVRA